MESISTKIKKTVIARLDAGDDLLLSIKKCAEEHNIKCGFFNVIGGLGEINYALYEKKKYRIINKKAVHCFELLPTSGSITLKDNEVLVHCHINAGDEKEGHAFGGHLMEGTKIFPFGELVICECDATIGRKFDENLNLYPMVFYKKGI